jgi:hypothetical protein
VNQAPEFRRALDLLARHQVEFIVVGGVAAVLQGAPISTFDLDVVYRVSQDNITLLSAALAELEAVYRDPAGRRIAPDAARLNHPGHHLLLTRFGPVDVLGSLGEGARFEDLEPRSSFFDVGGLRVRVLDLSAVLESKTRAARPKDRAVLEILQETLRLRAEC